MLNIISVFFFFQKKRNARKNSNKIVPIYMAMQFKMPSFHSSVQDMGSLNRLSTADNYLLRNLSQHTNEFINEELTKINR